MKLAKRGFMVANALLTLLAVPSLRQDVAAWAPWLRWLNRHWAWAVPITAFLLLAFAVGKELQAAHKPMVSPPGVEQIAEPHVLAAAAIREIESHPVGVPGWDSRIEHVLPGDRYPIHGLMAKLYGPEGKPTEGKVRMILRLGPNIIREEEARFDDYYLQPGERPHYSSILYNPLRPENRLEDGLYELRWIEAHALGHRDMVEPHNFEIRQGLLVVTHA